MKLIYSEVFKKINLNKQSLSLLEKNLPPKFFLAYSIQYRNLAFAVKKEFSDRIIGFSQVLGCSKLSSSGQEVILLLGEARFHALNLLKFSKKVIVFDGYNLQVLDENDKETLDNQNRIKFTKLLHSNKAGILVSTKAGQYNIGNAVKAINHLKSLDKKPYLFLFETLNISDMENFNLESWINTSCIGLEYDSKSIISLDTFTSLINTK